MADCNTNQYEVGDISPQRKFNLSSLSKPPNAPKKKIPKSRLKISLNTPVRRRLFFNDTHQSQNFGVNESPVK